MGDLYTVLKALCDERKITGYKMCKDCGVQPSIMTDLKMGRRSGLKAETAAKIASYFGVTVDYLLTGEQKEKPAEKFLDEQIKDKPMAAYGEVREFLSDEAKDDIARFIRFRASEDVKKK